MNLYRNGVGKSLGKEKIVRGYRVNRMPLGRFLMAMEKLQEAPEQWLEEIMPNKGEVDLLTALKSLDAAGVKRALLKAARILPGYAVRLFAEISGIEEERLLNDPAIGLDGLLDLARAFWEVNRMENFFIGAAEIMQGIRELRRNAGSRD